MALPRIEVQVTADTDQAINNLDRFNDGLSETAAKAKSVSAPLGTARGQVRALGRDMKASSAHTTNLMFQFQDIGMMLAAGQSPLMLAMQQGTQVSGVFQQMKNSGQSAFSGIIGGLAGMVSPLSLVTIGAIAGGAALVQWAAGALGASEDAIKLDEQLNELTGSVNTYISALEQASLSSVDLVSKYGMQAEELQRIYDLNVALRKIELQQKITDFAAQANEAYSGLASDIERIIELSRAATQTTMSQSTAQDLLNKSIGQLRDEYGLAVGQAIDLNNAIQDMANATTMDEHAAAATKFGEALIEAQRNGATIPPEMVRIAIEAGASAQAIRDLEAALYDAADAASTITIPGGGGGGRGDPRQFTNTDEFRKQLADQEAWAERERERAARSGRRGRRSGGGGRSSGGRAAAVDPNQARIESLIESLKTEREVLEEWRTEGLELLNTANEAELEALGGHAEAKLRLEEEYQERLKGMRQGYNGDALDQAQQFFGDMANAMQSGNDKMQRIAQTFASIEALINAYRAYNQVIADPSLPWYAKIPAAAGVLAAGMKTVQSLKSLGGGGGGASGGGGGVGETPSEPSQQPLDVRVSGLSSGQLMDGMDVGRLLERLQDEAGDRGLRITVAR